MPSSDSSSSNSSAIPEHGAWLLRAFEAEMPEIRISFGYRLGVLVVTMGMILLPLIYLGLIALTAYGVYYHATEHLFIMEHVFSVVGLVLYLTPILAGVTLVGFMVKQFFPPVQPAQYRLRREDEPLLFAYVDRLCRLVRAPVPHEIHLDCEVNASASFWGGLSGLVSRRLVLSIGAPLLTGLSLRELTGVLAHEFGHFAQGGGMRMNYIVRSVSVWFARVVYERNEMDAWIEVQSEQEDWISSTLFGITRAFVWLSRCVLWPLMIIGHGMSSFMMRQMEYNADQYEIALVGSRSFESSMRRLSLLVTAANRAQEKLIWSWQRGRLADNYPSLVQRFLLDMPHQVQHEAQRQVAATRTGWFDSHPCDADRIRQAHSSNAPGVFRLDPAAGDRQRSATPADLLFADFERVARSVTQQHYRSAFRQIIEAWTLVPTGAFYAQERDIEVLGRYTQGTLCVQNPLAVRDASLAGPVASAEESRQRLEQLRERLLKVAPDSRFALVRSIELAQRIALLARVRSLAKLGYPIAPHGLRSADLADPDRSLDAAQKQRAHFQAQLDPATTLLRERMRIAFAAFVERAPWVEPLEDADAARCDVERLWPLVPLVERLIPSVFDLAREAETLESLIKLQQKGSGSGEAIGAIEALGREMVNRLESIAQALGDTSYPFESPEGEIRLSEHLLGRIPSAGDQAAIIHGAKAVRDQIHFAYCRILGRLAYRADQVEGALGLEPLAEPPAYWRDSIGV